MTELETMQRAKMYMDKLAQGIDPITDREVPEDSVLNQLRLARCFFYVSEVLGRVIANGGVIGGKPELQPFVITPQQLAAVPISPGPVRITQLVEQVNMVVNDPQRKKLSAGVISNWLLDKGYLEKKATPDGTSKRLPSAAGMRIGMTSQLCQGRHGEFFSVYYAPQAQRFVLDHLPDMLR